MEALAEAPIVVGRRVDSARPGYVPALPTLWPSMLLRDAHAEPAFPFDAPAVRYFYFARNAVWLATRLLALDGGELLVPAYHHGVEVEALIDAGAKVRFYRVDANMQPDVEDIRRRIGPNTRGIYLIHYLGFPGPTQALRGLCDERKLALVEDCALALLSSDGQEPLGTQGDASIFCLYKTLPTPHGGALVLGRGRPAGLPEAPTPPRMATARHLLSGMLMNLELRGGAFGGWLRRQLRSMGRTASDAAHVGNVATGTQHFNPEHSALGASPIALKLALAHDMREVVDARRRNYFLLLSRLRRVAAPVFPSLPAGVCPLFYPLRCREPDRVADALLRRGVETVPFWRGGHPACDLAEFPEVAELRRTILEIPIHQDVNPQQAAALANAVLESLAEVAS